MALLENVDPNPENFVCAGVIQTKAQQVGSLLRLEPNAQAQVWTDICFKQTCIHITQSKAKENNKELPQASKVPPCCYGAQTSHQVSFIASYCCLCVSVPADATQVWGAGNTFILPPLSTQTTSHPPSLPLLWFTPCLVVKPSWFGVTAASFSLYLCSFLCPLCKFTFSLSVSAVRIRHAFRQQNERLSAQLMYLFQLFVFQFTFCNALYSLSLRCTG